MYKRRKLEKGVIEISWVKRTILFACNILKLFKKKCKSILKLCENYQEETKH
jgi:hypothetical protein